MKRALLALVCVTVLVACTPGANTGDTRDRLDGTQGVHVELFNVPSTVYEREQFPVMLRLENRGAYNVSADNPGYFYVSTDSLYLSRDEYVTRFHEAENAFWLRGRQLYVPGEEAVITQYLTAQPIMRQSSEVRTPITVTACYPYQSTTTTQVCIERARFAETGSVACIPRPVRPPTPGAPVGVSEVETRTQSTPDGDVSVTFRITIRNFGQGIASGQGCVDGEHTTQLNNRELNAVRVSAFLLTEPLECGVSYEDDDIDIYQPLVRLVRGQGTVVCRLPEGAEFASGESNFLSLLTVDIDYSYRASDRAEVRIVR